MYCDFPDWASSLSQLKGWYRIVSRISPSARSFSFAAASSLYDFPQYISLKTEKTWSVCLDYYVELNWSLIWPNFRFGSLPRLLCLLLREDLESNQRILFRLSGHISDKERASISSRCLPCHGFKLKVKLIYSGNKSEMLIVEILVFQRLLGIHSNSDQIWSTFSKPEIRELYASSSETVIISSTANKNLFLLSLPHFRRALWSLLGALLLRLRLTQEFSFPKNNPSIRTWWILNWMFSGNAVILSVEFHQDFSDGSSDEWLVPG